MYCKSRTFIPHPLQPNKKMFVDCKKCIPCKIHHTAEWAMRLEMELKTNPKARFVTLTYNDENLPEKATLVKEHLQAFNKAIRQEFPDRRFRFFECGEYGEKGKKLEDGSILHRPHYHLIFYGIEGTLEERQAIYNCWQKCDEFQFLGKDWYKACGTVTHDSCLYVSSYCQKKLFGEMAEEEYTKTGRIQPFQLQSNRIGEEYFLQNIELYKELGYIPYHGIKMPIPETWKRKFEIESDFAFEIQNEVAKKFLRKHKEISEEEYNHFKFRYGVSMADCEEWLNDESVSQKQAVLKTIEAKNNLRRSKNL